MLGLDSLDWQIVDPLIENGELPNLARLRKEGASGDLATLNPTISPILWNSIATGKRAGKHGIHGFTEVDPVSERVRPVSSLSRSSKAIWNILMQEGFVCHVLNWFASHPAEPLNGSCVSDLFTEGVADNSPDWPLSPDSVYPQKLEAPLADLRINLDEIPGDLLEVLVPDAAKVDQKKDKRLHILATELAKAYSVHAAATWLLENRDWDFLAVYWRTPDLLKHHFMPFHPPAVDGVSEEGAGLYRSVVSGVYRLFDQIVGRYMELAPEETNLVVLSDHGFQSGDLRPNYDENPFKNPEAWHRPQGVFIAKGPSIARGVQVFGARLLDITPTLLVLNGVQPAFDMDGRVLTEIFENEPLIEPIDSYEKTGDEGAGLHPSDKAYTVLDAEKMVQQFVDLGYIAPLDADKEKAAQQTRYANKNNLARDYLDAGRPGLALPLLEDLHESAPESVGVAGRLAYAQRQLGLVAEAEETLEKVCQTIKEGPMLPLLRAEICLDRKDYVGAVDLLRQLEQEHAQHGNIQGILGRTYNLMGEFEAAKACFQRALERYPDDARSLQGLALVALKQQNYTETLDYALRAIDKKPDLYHAHYYLGRAADKLGLLKEAIRALKSSLSYGPRNRTVHMMLARLLQKAGNEEEAQAHRQVGAVLFQQGKQEKERVAKLRENIRERSRQRKVQEKDGKPAAALSQGGEITTSSGDEGMRESLDLVLVSGIPRSGTSLMMQVLARGGLEALQDDRRKADDSNLEGYFEFESIKSLKDNPRVVEQGVGKVTKVISMLLPHLPREHQYRVVYMRRNPIQVAASQARMLDRIGKDPAYLDAAKVAELISKHDEETLRLLEGAKNIDFIVIEYERLVQEPMGTIGRVREFLGDLITGSLGEMSKAIKPDLWRER